MKNYRNKSTHKGIKNEVTVKYGVSKSDAYAPQNTNDAKTISDTEKGRISFAE